MKITLNLCGSIHFRNLLHPTLNTFQAKHYILNEAVLRIADLLIAIGPKLLYMLVCSAATWLALKRVSPFMHLRC